MLSPVFSYVFQRFPFFFSCFFLFPLFSHLLPCFPLFSPVFLICFPVFFCFSLFSPFLLCFPMFFSVFACFPVFCHMFYMERDFKKIITYTLEDNIGEVGQKGNRSIRLYCELKIAETRFAHKTTRTPGFFLSFLFFFCSKFVGGLIENTARK